MFIIRLEYQFNAVEMALKKVHGYTLLNRNWRILKTTVYGALVGILTALFLSIVLQMPGGVPLVFGRSADDVPGTKLYTLASKENRENNHIIYFERGKDMIEGRISQSNSETRSYLTVTILLLKTGSLSASPVSVGQGKRLS